MKRPEAGRGSGGKRPLLVDPQARFSQAMSESVFVDLLLVPMAMKPMNSEAGFPDQIAELIDGTSMHAEKLAACAHVNKKLLHLPRGGGNVLRSN